MPARNVSRVTLESAFPEWGADAIRNIIVAVDSVTPEMATAARAVEKPRDSGDLNDSIHPLPAVEAGPIIQGGIGASDWKANWYEQGTGTRRSKRLKHSSGAGRAANKEAARKAGRKSGAKAGIPALHYLRKGLTAGRVSMFEAIAEAIRSASVRI